MTGSALRASERVRHREVGLALLAVAVALAACGLVGVAAAQSSGVPPGIGNATRENATTMRLTVVDDGTVDESSISADDFEVPGALIDSVRVNASGNRSIVHVHVATRQDRNNVTVRVVGSIEDTDGNALTDASVVVSGMDSVSPTLRDFRIKRVNATARRFVVDASEPLGHVKLAVSGPSIANLNRSAFHATGDGTYAATRNFPEQGQYGAILISIGDRYGNRIQYNAQRLFAVDEQPPAVHAAVPSGATAGRAYAFDASATTDNVGVDAYRWTFPSGTETGATVTHAFDAAGNHTVSLTVTDSGGNTVTRNWTVHVSPGATAAGVNVTASAPDRASAVVAPDRPRGRALLSREDPPLVARANLTLRTLTVGVADPAPVGFSVSASDRVPAAFTAATNRTAIGSFAVSANTTVDNATFTFGVARERLRAAGIDPANVTLYHGADGWVPLETRRIRANETRIVYEAPSPGFSTFVVGESGAGPHLAVVNATLGTERVAPGGYAVVDATVANTGTATGTTTLALTVDGTRIARRTVTVPTGERRTVQFAGTVDVGGPVSVGAYAVGNLTVGRTNGTATDGGTTTPGGESAGNASGGNATGENTSDGNVTGGTDSPPTATATPAPANSSTPPSTATPTPATSSTATPGNATSAENGSGNTSGLLNETGNVTGNATGPSNGTGTAAGSLPLLGLLPGGLFGTALGSVFWLSVTLFASLKAVAIYLGY